jgi:branched-chain amino acid transport system substrate-binding protein
MTMRNRIRRGLAALVLTLAGLICAAPVRAADPDPIKIGFSMELTGPFSVVGKTGLAAFQIWAEDVNAKGGLLGRAVKLVYYDDQSNPANVPGIYEKLISVDNVDLLVSSYGTNLVVPAMPVAIQHNRLFFGLFALAANDKFHYPKYFSMLPFGPEPVKTFAEGYFDLAAAQNPKPKTVAIVAADAEFQHKAAESARGHAKRTGMEIVYDRAYPPNTVDFSPIVRAIQAAKPDIVYMSSYPSDTVGILRSIGEIGLDAKMIGGLMTGLLATPFKLQLGPLLDGIVNNQLFIPGPAFDFPGTKSFLAKYQAKAPAEGLDPLGFAFAPFAYATGQVLAEAVEGANTLDQEKLAQYMHTHGFHTIVGDIAFNEDGEWVKPRQVFTQFQNIKANDIDQFRDGSHEPILWPPEMKSGTIIYPFTAARK